MHTLGTDVKGNRVEFKSGQMSVYLDDGRILTIPLDWYPRLERATARQRKNYKFIYDREAMEWPDIDEHISIAGLLKGAKAPRSLPYLTGKWPEHIERERKRIEASYKPKKSLPGKRAAKDVPQTRSQKS
ncbi:MAG TPA: DUF2442 domain-containing protein [Candidatus Kapabacteria bacterium]|jgi:hypothetical protein|nr:DUF2442 domain-containing protein [Candidatus Kapabacteria bacterium]